MLPFSFSSLLQVTKYESFESRTRGLPFSWIREFPLRILFFLVGSVTRIALNILCATTSLRYPEFLYAVCIPSLLYSMPTEGHHQARGNPLYREWNRNRRIRFTINNWEQRQKYTGCYIFLIEVTHDNTDYYFPSSSTSRLIDTVSETRMRLSVKYSAKNLISHGKASTHNSVLLSPYELPYFHLVLRLRRLCTNLWALESERNVW